VGFAFPEGRRIYQAPDMEAHQQVVTEAIEKAASQFNLFIRGIARSRLKDSNPIFSAITFEYSGQTLSLEGGGKSLVMDGTKGERVPFVTPKGKHIEVAQFIEDGEARRVYYNADGRREVQYKFGDNGESLTLHVSIYSKYLDEPVTYRLRYLMKK